MKPKKISKFIYWTPRILSIAFILFLALFSLDVISPELPLEQILLRLFMHNIPVFILTIALIISWKYEIVGGITYILAGITYIFFTLGRNEFQWHFLVWILQISVIAFLVGILFLINWYKKK